MYTKQECISHLRKISEKVDGALTVQEYRELNEDGPSDRTLLKKFGTWNEAKEKAGLEKLRHGENKKSHGRMRISHHGYEVFRLGEYNERKRVKIHRLLAVAKYGVEEVAGMVVHHKNEIKWDNRMENLELMTHGEHVSHHRKKANSEK